MIQAVIFDLDGTLVDSNELHVASWDEAFRHFGKRFSLEQLRKQIGKGSDQYLPEFLDEEEIKEFGKQLDEYRSELFTKDYLPRMKPFPKVRELFERIKADKKRIALAASSKSSESKVYKNYDVEAAQKIGLKTIGFLCGGRPEELLLQAGAIAIYRDPTHLLEQYERSPIATL